VLDPASRDERAEEAEEADDDRPLQLGDRRVLADGIALRGARRDA